MFNTTILDVAIGMIFVYLLLSLMCSAANEIIELLLKKRAVDLERGIRELLLPDSKSGGDDIVRKLYNHPLVNGLFGGKYEDSKITSRIRYVWRTQLPSYIPARSFALALMDLFGTPKPSSAADSATQPPPSGTAGATPVNYEVKLTEPAPPPLAPGATNNPLTPLRKAIAGSDLLKGEDTKGVQDALIALVDAAGSDVAKARENIENWYNNSMDRVSSWYKRRTQIVILIVGLFIAVTVNADTITMVRRLSTDKALRESLVSAAQEYAKAHASPAAAATASTSPAPTTAPSPRPKPSPAAETSLASSSPSPAASVGQSPSSSAATTRPNASPASSSEASASPSPVASSSPIPECASDANSPACRYATLLLKIQECVKDKNSPECKHEASMQMIPACGEKKDLAKRTSPECKYEFNKQQIESLGLPIGWTSFDDPQRRWPGSNWSSEGGWKDQIYWHWLGWLLTALAISLGAPFWFDLLNKFIVIRSAVKPHEKSPEEESKD